ncbi:SusC/RagA family TonB-linked outer membrane protein [Polaribacter sp. KT 15]|uniref:SusC/RagA family TonB-linked outer membrane protein n=1 Tax=Polaribacter sp. KT 15 TaxID=1896175 RepID=UPI00090C9611|nr:SusC/RagA family TonB-linked outer membrane protein [Polaribacter sp. KT 15]SHM78209.1 TonB-linked outer membrane protein, SusC/RagA family [Polaribacter sp. KT 15]
MKTKFNGILTLLLALVVQISFAQQKTVSGTVTDDSGALPGVSVVIKGTSTGTETNFDGKYTLKASKGDVLVFRYLGYKVVERVINNSNSINVKLVEDANVLEEIVVTGYTTITKAKASTSSTQLNASAIENRPSGNLVNSLAGQVPGLDISISSGQPGANALVQLRGVNSINGNTEPLFILDGTPVDEDNFRSINQNEIASVTVLKDAGATAIYGSRGANGVIVIKTKTGRKNAPLAVNFNSVYSISQFPSDRYNLMNSQQYATLERQRGIGLGAGASVGISYPANGSPLTDEQIAALPNGNWEDEFLRMGQTKNHTLTLTSGGENSSQFTFLGYFEQEGILAVSDLKRFNLRNNINGGSDKFKYGTSVSLNYSTNNTPTSVGTSGINQNPFFGANGALPYLLPEETPTVQELVDNLIFGYSPYFIQEKLFKDVSLVEELKIIASVNASLNLTDNLVASVNTGVDYQATSFVGTRNPEGFNAQYFNPDNPGFSSQNSRRRAAFNTTASLNYNIEFDKHTINAGLYTEYFKAFLRDFGFTSNGLNPKTFFPGDGAGFIGDNANDDLFVDTVFANRIDAGLLSYFGTLDYDYDSTLGLSATFRRDASYRFSTTNRWANFWSVSGRVNIDQFDFMEDSVFNQLKLRGSYGTTGNQRINGGNYYTSPDLAFDFFATGVGYNGEQTIGLSQLGNDTLKWETVAQANIGLDFGLWNSRLRGSVDYYRKKTTDLFQSLPVSAITSVTSINSNVGSLHNNGLDVNLAYDIIKNNDFKLTFNTVANFNKNYLADLPAEVDEVTGEVQIVGIGRNGGPIFERFDVRYAGVNPANGNELFYDKDGNITETPNPDTDRVWSGLNTTPEVQGSFAFNGDFKGFFFEAQFAYVLGVDQLDFDYANFMDPGAISQFNLSSDLLRAWTPTNRITDVPSIQPGGNVGTFASNRFLADKDYLRLRFASIGYAFPQEVLKKVGLNTLRIFANGENLVTFTKFRGFDAASRLSGREYPTPVTFSLGVEIGL